MQELRQVGLGLLVIVVTAVVGSLLVPWVKDSIDRRRARFDASTDLVDTLANCLWTYWKLALRVAYYGKQGDTSNQDYRLALTRWDSDEAWELGNSIQIKVSKSRRLLGEESQWYVHETQRKVVAHLDREVERLRRSGTTDDWKVFYHDLM